MSGVAMRTSAAKKPTSKSAGEEVHRSALSSARRKGEGGPRTILSR